jgi:NADH dehydrogenase
LAQARRHRFIFRLGAMEGLDREKREIHLAPIRDPDGETIAPARTVPYDTLVIAVGSVSNDFGVPGVREHCRFLDTRQQADAFQRALLGRYLKAQTADVPPADALRVAIVGGGATGVELAAELHHVARRLVAYGFDRIDPDRDVRLVLVEAADRLLPSAPERVSKLALEELTGLGIEVHTGTAVTRVTDEGLETKEGTIPAGVSVWAAGIQAPEFLSGLGLETDRIGRLVVGPDLATTRDPAVYALGDCTACPWPHAGRSLPPTAQVAHQQAMYLSRTLPGRVEGTGKPRPPFSYHDYGAMVSLSHYTAVGNLMGNLMGRLQGTVMIEGKLARLTYRLLYRKHQRAIYGTLRTALLVLADAISRRGRARLKLH